MIQLLFTPVLLQITEGVKSVSSATAEVSKALANDPGNSSTTHLLWWMVCVLAVVSVGLGTALVKVLTGRSTEIEAACKQRLDGYQKAELELKAKHATEIGLNEANHQSVVKGLQRSLDDSNTERRELTNRINSMAHDMAELFDTFAAKINTFAELQASQVARLETVKVEILLEISRHFSKT